MIVISNQYCSWRLLRLYLGTHEMINMRLFYQRILKRGNYLHLEADLK